MKNFNKLKIIGKSHLSLILVILMFGLILKMYDLSSSYIHILATCLNYNKILKIKIQIFKHELLK